VLAGGRGVRLGSLTNDTPKPLLEVAGRCFLEWVLLALQEARVNEVVIAAGYRGNQIAARFRSNTFAELSLTVHVESSPLGTGGAIAEIFRTLPGDEPILVTNGDSALATDLSIAFDRLTSSLDATMIGVRVDDASRYGRVQIAVNYLLTRLDEPAAGEGLINAGVYVLRRALVAEFPLSRPLSFEREVLPSLVAAGAKIGVVTVDAPFIDIGMPESLESAPRWLSEHFIR